MSHQSAGSVNVRRHVNGTTATNIDTQSLDARKSEETSSQSSATSPTNANTNPFGNAASFRTAVSSTSSSSTSSTTSGVSQNRKHPILSTAAARKPRPRGFSSSLSHNHTSSLSPTSITSPSSSTAYYNHNSNHDDPPQSPFKVTSPTTLKHGYAYFLPRRPRKYLRSLGVFLSIICIVLVAAELVTGLSMSTLLSIPTRILFYPFSLLFSLLFHSSSSSSPSASSSLSSSYSTQTTISPSSLANSNFNNNNINNNNNANSAIFNQFPLTLDQILYHQPSSFVSPLGNPVSVSALLFLSVHTSPHSLSRLITQLSQQTFAPSSVLIVLPEQTLDEVQQTIDSISSNIDSESIPPLNWWITLRPFDPNIVSNSIALQQSLVDSKTDLSFVVDLDSYSSISLGNDTVEIFARAASASTHSSALLSSGGLYFGTDNDDDYTINNNNNNKNDPHGGVQDCISGPKISQAAQVHFPTSPLILRPSWLAAPEFPFSFHPNISSPFANIAYVLSRYHGIPSLSLPLNIYSNLYDQRQQQNNFYIKSYSDDISLDHWSADNCLRSFSNIDLSSRPNIIKDLKQSVFVGPSRGLIDSMISSTSSPPGQAVFLVGNRTEIQLVSNLACQLQSNNFNNNNHEQVQILVLDHHSSQASSSFSNRPALSPVGFCNIVPKYAINSTTTTSSSQTASQMESLDIALANQLVKNLKNVAAWFYLSRSQEQYWIEGTLRRLNANFGDSQSQRPQNVYDDGNDLSHSNLNRLPGAAIKLPPQDLAYTDWIGALPSEALRHWHKPRIDLSIITNNRPDSLERLLDSINNAVYFGDNNVPLVINLEQTADKVSRDFVESFDWTNGPYTVRHRVLLGGLLPAVTESWYPSNNDTYGVLLEDDVELSPLYYGWLKYSILYYRYYEPMKKVSKRMFGVSLYQQRALEYLPDGRKAFNASTVLSNLSLPPYSPYLTPIPCSWGAAFFPEVWREFHEFLSLRLSQMAFNITTPIVPNVRSNRWPRSWKRYFVELVYLRGYTMLYPNYPASSSFSTNHLEIGDHVKDLEAVLKRKALFEVPLRELNQGLLTNLPQSQLPNWTQLPVIDIWGNLATETDLISRGRDTFNSIQHNCPQTPPSLQSMMPPTFDARELLCKKPKKNKKNSNSNSNSNSKKSSSTSSSSATMSPSAS